MMPPDKLSLIGSVWTQEGSVLCVHARTLSHILQHGIGRYIYARVHKPAIRSSFLQMYNDCHRYKKSYSMYDAS
jgi:hypothetical protein